MKRFLLATIIPILIVAALNWNVLYGVIRAKLFHPSPEKQAEIVKQEEQADNTIVIPSLGITAPVVASPADPTEVSDWNILKQDLTKGVSLTEKLAKPGEEGVSIILGHSSDTNPHPYAAVFASLNELRSDDIISLKYKGQTYQYKVTNKDVVEPTDPLFATFKEKGQAHRLALVTCWPLLTTAKRLVVVASPI